MKNKIAFPNALKFIAYLHLFIFVLIISLLLSAFSSFYLPAGTLRGKVIDKETQKPISFVNVVVLLNDTILVGGAISDFEGNYVIKPIEPGIYSVKATFVGYKQIQFKGIAINADEVRFCDFELEESSIEISGVEVVDYFVPLIDMDQSQSGGRVTSREIKKMPGRNANSSISTHGVAYSADGSSNGIRVSRSNNTIFVDGIRVNNSSSLPPKNKSKNISSQNTEEIVIPIESMEEPGQLTAGEIHDFSKWKLWEDLSAPALSTYQKTWNFFPHQRYCVQLTSLSGFPVIDCSVQLINKSGEVIWESKTDNTGKTELWANMFNAQNEMPENNYSIKVLHPEETLKIEKAKAFHKGINTMEINTACNAPQKADVLFVVDATGSMSDEIGFLKIELNNIINRIIVDKPGIDLNLGSIFYRCERNSYTTLQSPFSANINKTIDFIKDQDAGEGGVEAVELALDEAINDMEWSEEAITRLLFIILDEAPGTDAQKIKILNRATAQAARKGIRIVPIVASGTSFHLDKSLEFLMRSLALATNGTYVFLTNDSGIGNNHTKPSTDKYSVELLNDLIPRLFYQFTETPECNETEFVDKNNSAKVNVTEQEEKENSNPMAIKNLRPVNEEGKIKIEKLKIFPNPTSGKITINSKKKIKQAFLTDISGKILEHYDLKNSHEKILFLDRFPTGIYFIKYRINDKWENVKVILRR
jgi:hypothetical protein